MENKINEELSNSGHSNLSSSYLLTKKLDEFISLLSEKNTDPETLKELDQKFKNAISSALNAKGLPEYPEAADIPCEFSSDVGQLLSITNTANRRMRRLSALNIFKRVVRLILSVLLILLGFGMIIMPAPPYFEMFTLFYLNPNDGVTIMDIISLIVAFTGLYICVSTLTRIRR